MRFGLPSIIARRASDRADALAVDALAGRLVAYEERLKRLPQWLHASWLQDLGLQSSTAGHPSLPAALGVGSIPAHVLERSANGLALLPPACLCRVLRARALLRRRSALRRCVEPRLRRSMNDWLHPVVFDAVLLESPDDGLHLDTDGLPWPPGPDAHDTADALAWEGFCLFQQDTTWTDRQVIRLIRLGFAIDAVPPPALKAQPGAANGSVWVMDRLARFSAGGTAAVWLKCGSDSVAFDDDVIPRDALQRLLTLDSLEAHAALQRESFLRAAESAATAVADKARSDAAAVTRLGYAQGRRDALRHWHAEAASQRAAAAARHAELRGRLADMVAQATASLVRGPVLEQYLHEALQALDGLAEAESLLTLSVHPEDSAVAQAAVDALRHRWSDGTVVKIIESDTLARGSCVCESAQGYVDASLSVQLATLRQAALGALQGLDMPGFLPPMVAEVSPDAAPLAEAPVAQPMPLPSYLAYAPNDDPDDREDNDDDTDFDDDDMFDDEPASEGEQRPRW